jgi:hypothetical protein
VLDRARATAEQIRERLRESKQAARDVVQERRAATRLDAAGARALNADRLRQQNLAVVGAARARAGQVVAGVAALGSGSPVDGLQLGLGILGSSGIPAVSQAAQVAQTALALIRPILEREHEAYVARLEANLESFALRALRNSDVEARVQNDPLYRQERDREAIRQFQAQEAAGARAWDRSADLLEDD